MNNVILLGRLTKDVELKISEKTKKNYAMFSLAIPNGENTNFIDCIAFDKVAETINVYVKKGNRLLVEGSLNISTYTDKDGNTRKSTNVMVSKITFIETLPKKEQKKDKVPEELPFNI